MGGAILANVVQLTPITGSQTGCSYYAHSQPHAVRKIGSATYCYDANGNMTNRNGTSITWNSRNLPTSISTSGGISSQFSYGPSGNRWKQTASYSGGAETTVYVGGMMEKVTSGTTTYYRHYISYSRTICCTKNGVAGSENRSDCGCGYWSRRRCRTERTKYPATS